MTPLDIAKQIAASSKSFGSTHYYPDVDEDTWEQIEHELVCTLDYGVVCFSNWFALYSSCGLAFLDRQQDF